MTKLTEYFEEDSLLEETKPGREAPFTRDVLLDADALVALAKSDDSNHKKAVKISRALQKRGVSYCLSPFTVAEAATVLSYKVSHSVAKAFLEEIRKIDLPVLELPEKYRSLADGWFLKQKKKGVSHFDCYNMALLERYKKVIEMIFSFDSIYRKNGFKTTADLKI